MIRLTRQGYPVDMQGKFGATALMRSSFRGHKDLVELLLLVGANPDIKDAGGATAVHIASREGHAKIVEMPFEVYKECRCNR